MTGEDLYKEVQCTRCGNTILKSASFCAYCGHVRQEHWWDRLIESLRGSGSDRPTRVAIVSTLIGLVIASFFLYTAIQKQSLQSLIIAILTLIFAFRSWFATRGKVEEAGSETVTTHHRDNDMLGESFYCENCGSRVDEDAETCPKCGMRFG